VWKRVLVTALFAAGLAFIGSTTPSAYAQGPIDNQVHTIGGGGNQWYSFTLDSNPSPVTLTLFNGVPLSLAFNVFAPNNSDQPVGRGTPSNVVCSSGDRCHSSDLTWTGGANAPGTYQVQVINNSPNTVSYQLTLTTNGSTPTQPYTYYYPPYVAPYGQPYPYTIPYVAPYVPPYYVPGNITPYLPKCTPGFYLSPYVYIPPYCR
jgi:hypothetical protein